MRSPPGAVAALASVAAQLATAALVPRDAAAPTTAAMPLPFPAQVGIDDSNLATCANANWPPPSSPVGEVISAQLPDADLQAALGEVDPARIRAIVDKLVGFGTRHTLSTQTDPTRGIGAARDWIAEEMRGYAATAGGRMEVTVPGYVQGVASRISFPVKISNVVATLKGDKDPDRVYVVSGHYDSRVTDVMNYEADAPGANDDASGVACGFSSFAIFYLVDVSLANSFFFKTTKSGDGTRPHLCDAPPSRDDSLYGSGGRGAGPLRVGIHGTDLPQRLGQRGGRAQQRHHRILHGIQG